LVISLIRTATPFIKWAGGKSQMLAQYATLIPDHYHRYFEPFVGGGAVFFSLNPRISFLADVNTELINTYTVVRDSVEELITSLKKHINEKEYYYYVRGQCPDQLSVIERASRFIYLNKTCYNGLYRVNKAGIFNVPFGKYKNPKIVDELNLRAANYYLQSVRLTATNFEEATQAAAEGDFVYLDPPYHPLNNTSKFTNYAENGFTSVDQQKLFIHYRQLHSKGCLLMLSNSDTPFIRDLYAGFDIREVNAKRMINCQSNKRGEIKELVIRNYVR
jgi:DNA adenine methylase